MTRSQQGHLQQKTYKCARTGKVKKSNWFLIYYERGQRREVSTGAKKRQDAELFRSEFMAKFRRRGGDSTPEAATINDLLDLVAADFREQRRRSTDDQDGKIEVLRELIGKHRAATFGSRAMKDLVKSLRARPGKGDQKELSNGSINRYLATLRRAFKLGYQQEPRLVDSIPPFRMMPEAAPRTGFLGHEKYLELREHLPSYAALPLVIGYHTGMRLGEILELQTSDVDLAASVINVRRETTKNGEPKVVPIYGHMAGAIAEAIRTNDPRCPYLVQRWEEGGRVYRHLVTTPQGSRPSSYWSIALREPATVRMLKRAGQPEKWLLRTKLPIKARSEEKALEVLRDLGAARRGEPVQSFRKVWASACRAVGLPGLKFHDLRRTAAVNMIEAGLDQKMAMEIGGWKTDVIFRRYRITPRDRVLAAGAKLSANMARMTAEVVAKPAGRVS